MGCPPSPEATDPRSKPTYSKGPWWDVEAERWVDDNFQPLLLLQGNHIHSYNKTPTSPLVQINPGCHEKPGTIELHANETVKCGKAMLDFSHGMKNEAQSQPQYPRKAAPPLPGVEELVATDMRQSPQRNLKRQREGLDSYNTSGTGFGDLGPKSQSKS